MSQTRRFGRLCLLTCAAFITGWVSAFAETLTVVWDPNTDPEVAGYVVYIGSTPGGYTQRLDVGNVTRHDVNATAGQTYCFAVSSYAAGAVEGERSPEVCKNSNARPTMSNPGAQTSPMAQALTLALAAVDPEGVPLRFTATGLPAGLTVATATGFISGTPTQTGTTTVTATASDGVLATTVSFSWTITSGTPGAATLLRPSGAIATATPQFEWTLVPTATRYRLWVDDAGTNQQMIRDLTPADAGCTVAGSVCRAASGFTLVPGSASWSVRASNTSGDGPWSGSMDFAVPGGTPPAITIVTPTNWSTYSTTGSTLLLTGLAKDDIAVTQVSWRNDKGGSGIAEGTTTWGVAAVPLQPGTNVITVTARDGANNTATKVLTVTRTGDTQVPVVRITQPSSSATFSSPTTTLALGGTATDNVGVTEVRWVNNQGGSGVASGTASWSAGLLTLKAGTNVITVTARDAAGNTGTTALTVTVPAADAQVPTVQITQPTSVAALSTTSLTLGLGGTAADNVGVTEVRWGNNQGGAGVASGTTSWSAGTISLKGGVNLITVTARDAAGNSATDTLTVTVTDNVAPTVAIARPIGATSLSTPSSTATLSGTAADAFGVVQVTWANSRGGAGVVNGTTAWTVAGIPLQAGDNLITLTARDAAGLSGTDTIRVTRTDAEAPKVAFVVPTTSGTYTTGARTLALSGASTDAFGVSLVTWANSRGGSGNATGTTSWAVPSMDLQPGTNLITVTARDAAGNAGQAVLTVSVTDTTPPTVAVVSPVALSTYATTSPTVALAGTAADAGGVAQITWSSSLGGAGTAAGTTAWTVPAVSLVPGVNVITIVARDLAGNTGRTQLSVTATDTGAPVVTILGNGPAMTAGTLQVSGTASDNFGLASVSWRNSRGASGLAVGTSSWVVPSIPLQSGSNDITITATDKAGNSATSVLKVNANRLEKTATTSSGAASLTTSDVSTSPAATQVAVVESPPSPARVPQPQVTIQVPSTPGPWVASVGTVSLKGTASANVTRVTWSASWGGSGTASGTQFWGIPTVGLQIGTNTITVTATTADGRTARETVTVTYRPGR